MFNSGITVKSIIEDIKGEVDIAIPVPDETYVGWLCSLEQLIYSEIIREQAFVSATSTRGVVELSKISVPEDTDKIRYEDIYAVYCEGLQLKQSTLASGRVFPKCYFKKENNLALSDDVGSELLIIYIARPKIKHAESMENDYVMLPIEFLDLAKAKLRGESYKLANEDILAAKWLSDYNTLLETFKVWVSEKSPSFGI